ncbi:hypothetical protein [Nonomuraea aurantiaca]|uniref:hypothetical protein n=1 Tax=Nonomuraea aurantiaca TaxID=2878562 RepID=UPI001CD979F9|nr:hypothetical protein [Nonomuraea aurantiaca]MCA2230180.1 hypothetical protein [Nonomuraea aurantiaca]
MFEWLKAEHVRYCWLAAFAVTAIFGFGYTPWQTIQELIANQGVGDDGAMLIAFAAGYTFPAALGFALLCLLIDRGWLPVNGHLRITVVTAIFVITAALSRSLGLGLLVTAADPVPETGNPFARIPAYVLGAYLNTYGWGLMLTAAAIALASVATISV